MLYIILPSEHYFIIYFPFVSDLQVPTQTIRFMSINLLSNLTAVVFPLSINLAVSSEVISPLSYIVDKTFCSR